MPPSARPLELPGSGSDTIELQNLLSTSDERAYTTAKRASRECSLRPGQRPPPPHALKYLAFGVLSAPWLNPGALQ